MLSITKTCTLNGLSGNIIDVETDVTNGIPVFNIVGLPDASIKESKERVRSAVTNSGYDFPISRITVNLSPANLKKEGSQLDLPIALGILSASKKIKNIPLDACFIGELSLDGTINYIDGTLPMVISLREKGVENIFIPEDNSKECSYIEGVNIYPVNSLKELVDHLNNEMQINKLLTRKYYTDENDDLNGLDFSEIKGQHALKRAVEIASAGGHNILMIGPPGSGKTMIAKRIPTILPRPTFEESLEITKIHSIIGLNRKNGLIYNRPFRSPHHTISNIALVGGGRIPKPGEISLANYGVLFLDELPEFSKSALEVLRQPLEDGTVMISRANATISYPSKFMLVASMNPCPCGYYGDAKHECRCSLSQIDRYLNKISGPLLDRIDIQIEVSPVYYEDLKRNNNEESSEQIRKRVNVARDIQKERYKSINIYSNSELSGKQIKKYCKLSQDSEILLQKAFDRLSLSARAYDKILKVARTIADIDSSEYIKSNHLSEAIQYRNIDKKYWG